MLGLYSFTSEKEQRLKIDALMKENLSLIYGIERVYEGEKDYAETLSEIVDERATDVFVVNLDDLGRNVTERLKTLLFFKEHNMRLHIKLCFDDIFDSSEEREFKEVLKELVLND